MKQEDFRFYRRLKNVENEGKAGRYWILLMFQNMENEGTVR